MLSTAPNQRCESRARLPAPATAWVPAALMALLAVAGCSAPHIDDAKRQAEDAAQQDEPVQQPDAPPGGDQPDEPPALAIANASAPESTGVLSFPVSLSGTVSAPVTVSYGTEDGTALAGQHYAEESGTLTLGDGARLASVDVAILDGNIEEGDSRTFSVTLSNPTGATLSNATATGTITAGGESAATGPTSPTRPVDPCAPGNLGDPGSPPATRDSAPLALSSLAVTCGGSMYPPFAADTLHYALTCHGSPTLAVTAKTERAGARLTLLRADGSRNVVSTTGILNARIAVGGNHDVAIEVRDGDASRTYVAHCLPAAFPTIEILTRTGQVKDGLLLLTPAYGGYEHAHHVHGGRRQQRRAEVPPTACQHQPQPQHQLLGHGLQTPRQRRLLGGAPGCVRPGRLAVRQLGDRAARQAARGHRYRYHGVAPVADRRPRVPDSGERRLRDAVLLRRRAARLLGPRRKRHRGGCRLGHPAPRRRRNGGTSSFTWNSWDHRDVLQWGNDCKVGLFLRGGRTWPPGYAHVNGVQLLSDGDYVASSRGCAQVLRIDGTTGAVEWKLGGTAPPDGSTTEHLELAEHSDTCGRRGVLRPAPRHADLGGHGGDVRQRRTVPGAAQGHRRVLARGGIRHIVRHRRRSTSASTGCPPRRATFPTAAGSTYWTASAAACTG